MRIPKRLLGTPFSLFCGGPVVNSIQAVVHKANGYDADKNAYADAEIEGEGHSIPFVARMTPLWVVHWN